MKTPLCIARTLNLYRSIWQISPAWLVMLPVITIGATLSFMILLTVDNFLSAQFLTLTSITVVMQIIGLKLIQTAIYNNGLAFFSIPSRTGERLTAMLMILATNLIISIAACYIGFILLSLINSVTTEIFEMSPIIQIGDRARYCFLLENIQLFNPLTVIPPHLQLSYHDIIQVFCMLTILPAFCFLAAFLCTIITNNQWIKSSTFILLYTSSTIVFVCFIKHLGKETDLAFWQAIFLSPYAYILLVIGIIRVSFYKLKTKQIL